MAQRFPWWGRLDDLSVVFHEDHMRAVFPSELLRADCLGGGAVPRFPSAPFPRAL